MKMPEPYSPMAREKASVKPVSSAYYDAMFTEKGITKEQFRTTFDHYLDRPEELKAIQEEVIARLSKEKDEAAHTISH